MMRNVIYWIFRIIVLALTIKLALWAYQTFWEGSQGGVQAEVLDIDKICRIDSDSGRCICRHRQTNELLKISYEECVYRSRNP
jgi:hypothetical protein